MRRQGRIPAGVTYVELMIVVSLMLILAAASLPTARNVGRRAKEKELRAALHRIRGAIDAYHHDWERGFIESDHEHGWPASLEELTEEKDYTGESAPAAPATGTDLGRSGSGIGQQSEPAEPTVKVYLRRIPRDPFNRWNDEWDSSGWRARSYDDEPDSTSWGGNGVYDVYSSGDYLALDGKTRYPEW